MLQVALGHIEITPPGLQAPGASAPAAGGGNSTAADGSADVLAEVSFDGGFRLPGSIYNRLFDYQKTGMRVRPCPTFMCTVDTCSRTIFELNYLAKV